MPLCSLLPVRRSSRAPAAAAGCCCRSTVPSFPIQHRRIRAVTRRRWMRHLHAHISRDSGRSASCGRRNAPRSTSCRFSSSPRSRSIRGHASRFLLADEVGLGKTIQAGLMLAELRQRGWCERALIITPPGLRQQWADELRQRFDICSSVIGRGVARARRDSLPFDVNPWTVEPVVITSIDFIKQPEVLRGLAAQCGTADRRRGAPGDRRIAAIRGGRRAGRTRAARGAPHRHSPCRRRAGLSRPLRARTSSTSAEPILLFRRTREQAGLPRIAPRASAAGDQTPDAIEMHRLLDGVSRAALEDCARVGQPRSASWSRWCSPSALFRARNRSRHRSNGAWLALAGSDIDCAVSNATLPLASTTTRRTRRCCRSRRRSTGPDDERAVLQRLVDAARAGAERRAEDARAAADPPARPRAAHRLHRVSRHARSDAHRQSAVVRTSDAASWRPDAARAAGVGRAHSRTAQPICCSPPMRAPKGLNLQGTLPARHQSRASVEPDSARAARSAGSIASARRARCTRSTSLPRARQSARCWPACCGASIESG